ncbi:hypothetical protein ACET3X_008454 [Alternaria dauci]|uniref:DUF7607 domain-containing protein n=1 Tax=Alternaria dauci TaxID=48095 RepID=A0ABR3UBD8_9PLEO
MYRQHASTAGIGSLSIDNADNSLSVQPTGTSDNVVTDEAGNKRAKFTILSTAPLHGVPLISQATSNAAANGPLQQGEPDAEDYSHLLAWQNVAGGDEIVDLSDEDGQEDEDEGGLRDSAEEDGDVPEDQHGDAIKEKNKQSKLSQGEIVRIINEQIELYSNAWVPNKDIPLDEQIDYNPETMWVEAEAKGEREKLAQKYEIQHEYFRGRLDTLCNHITEDPGSNAKQVQQQCKNLEVTVDSMELAGWLRDIYKLEPVEDGEEEHVLDDQPRLQQDTSTHRVEPISEIIDLGSPSCPSDIEGGNAPLFDNDLGPAANSARTQYNGRTRSPTADSVIADSVEPVVYAHAGYLESESALPIRTPINHGDEPENASIATIRRWRWEDLSEHLDRKRVVSKVIQELESNDRETIRSRIQSIGKTSLVKEIRACVDMLCKRETKLQGVLQRDMHKILTFTALFLSWWFCSNYSRGPKASRRDLEELRACMDDGVAETSTFYDYVYTIMGTTFSEQALQHPDQPSQAEIIEISDDD